VFGTGIVVKTRALGRRLGVLSTVPEVAFDLPAARQHLNDGLIALGQQNVPSAEQHFKLAMSLLPPRSTSSFAYLFESYYEDLGQPMDEAEVLTSQLLHVHFLVEHARAQLGYFKAAVAVSVPHFYSFYDDYLRGERRHPKKITPYGQHSFSANDEDGLIDEIFKRIGTTNRYFVEFGVNEGTQCNTTALLMQGWKGLWLEASKNYLEMANYHFRKYIERDQLRTAYKFVTAENINETISRFMHPGIPDEIDFLSVDIDGNDYWFGRRSNASSRALWWSSITLVLRRRSRLRSLTIPSKSSAARVIMAQASRR
jgi:hypothetical protein